MSLLKLPLVAILFVSSLAFTATPQEVFEKNFNIIYKEGNIEFIKMKTFTKSPSLKLYVDGLLNNLEFVINELAQNGIDQDLEEDFYEYLEANSIHSDPKKDEAIEATKRSIRFMKSKRYQRAFSRIKRSGIFDEFQTKLKDHMKLLDVSILSAPMDSKFYLKKKAIGKVVQQLLKMAQKRFSNVPVLNTISFVLKKMEEFYVEQRTYYQHFLVYLMMNHENELDMNGDQINHILSSLYESQIPILNRLLSAKAIENWDRYGTDTYFTNLRLGKTKLRSRQGDFKSIGKQIGYAFVEVETEQGKMIMNLINSKHKYTSQMAVAYNYEKPKKVAMMRMLLNFSELGLGFIPVSNFIKKEARGFLQSLYREQRIMEGSLMAYFQVQGNEGMVKSLKFSQIDPFLLIK